MIYQERLDRFTLQIKEIEKKSRKISVLRLLAFAAAGSGFALVFYFNLVIAGWLIAAAGLTAFVALVLFHRHLSEHKRSLQLLCSINRDSISRREGTWSSFPDTGEEFFDIEHPYSHDLDIFGKGSLFQLINVAGTPLGRLRLKSMLENPYQPKQRILEMQDAVIELAGRLEWRQQFQAEGMRFNMLEKRIESYDAISKHERVLSSRIVISAIRTLPFLLIGSIAAKIFGFVPAAVPLFFLVVQMILVAKYFRKTNQVMGRLLQYHDFIRAYRSLIGLIEQESFSSPHLVSVKNELLNPRGKKASAEIRRLEILTDIVSMRTSMLHFPNNLLTMVDLQCLISFENWCESSGAFFEQWIGAVAQMEAVSSVSLLRYDNPQWSLPQIDDAETSFVIAMNAGSHPLIGKNGVANSFVSDHVGRINIITGSNMSGKSTFLRTVALNLVLAYIGSPVCAESMTCSIMKIFTSMRIIDNLGKHESSFYAELLRIKMIIDASKNREKIFFALDELFRGTNSRDRVLGARATIRSLSRENVAGMISTHDLELTELAKDASMDIRNYHFRESYNEEGILFDYTIYDGVSTTSDAVYLMKKAGIEI